MSGKPSRQELLIGIGFFAALALVTALFLRPLDITKGISLAISIGFVLAGSAALWKNRATAGNNKEWAGKTPIPAEAPRDDLRLDLDGIAGAPTPDERLAIETLLAALVEVEVLLPGEVDADLLWRAARYDDPSQAVGTGEALHALAILQEAGCFDARRMTFVPVHVEYDGTLLISITASILRSLGHGTKASDIRLTLSADCLHGSMSFPLGDRQETIDFRNLAKDAPPEIFPVLSRLQREEDPRDLICADPGAQALVFLAVQPGGLERLNQRLSGDDALFGPA